MDLFHLPTHSEGSFSLGAVVNSAAVNFHMQLSLCGWTFSPRRGFARLHGNSMSTFLTCYVFLIISLKHTPSMNLIGQSIWASLKFLVHVAKFHSYKLCQLLFLPVVQENV